MVNEQVKNNVEHVKGCMSGNFDLLSSAYWRAHSELEVTEFKNRREQIEAVKKLSEIGLALHSLMQAESAINKV